MRAIDHLREQIRLIDLEIDDHRTCGYCDEVRGLKRQRDGMFEELRKQEMELAERGWNSRSA